MEEQSVVISGWKEIANYLNRGVRTIQRYEHAFGLPIRRPARKHASVIAMRTELDAWVASCIQLRHFSTTMPAPNLEASQTTIMNNLQKMHALGTQMLSLRSEMIESVARIKKSVGRAKDGTIPGEGIASWHKKEPVDNPSKNQTKFQCASLGKKLQDDFTQNGFDFVMIDLDASIAFTQRALQTDDPEVKMRNVSNARKGYDTVVRLRKKLKLDFEQQRTFEKKRLDVKKVLEQLGEQF